MKAATAPNRRTRLLLMIGLFSLLAPVPVGVVAADLPPDLKDLVGTPVPAPGSIETANVLALNNSMFELYGDASQIFRKNLLANRPVILALFSSAGFADFAELRRLVCRSEDRSKTSSPSAA